MGDEADQALLAAASSGDTEAVRAALAALSGFLSDEFLSTNEVRRDEADQALLAAAYSGDTEAVRAALAAGANANCTNEVRRRRGA